MTPRRHYAASVFVVWRGRLMLHRHPKLGLWLPCGGHVEPGESPDEAALREVLEESGVQVVLVSQNAFESASPRTLPRPRGVQLEEIAPGHEHIDFIYFARPEEPYDGRLASEEATLDWYPADAVRALSLTDEVRSWAELALRELGPVGERSRDARGRPS